MRLGLSLRPSSCIPSIQELSHIGRAFSCCIILLRSVHVQYVVFVTGRLQVNFDDSMMAMFQDEDDLKFDMLFDGQNRYYDLLLSY